ncbi:MAG: ABC transporter ATP-binding protein, partial [Hyphococcus sp.]
HRRHFRQYFAQTISFLVIYAAASAVLLGLGGWLVIQGQLSLGQLVAAELVLSAVFFGISQFGAYVVYFYDLCAAVEELSRFLGVELEEPKGKHEVNCADSSLEFVDVKGVARNARAAFNFKIESGASVMATVETHGLQRLLTNLLKRHDEPTGGFITLGGVDVLDTVPKALHREIILLDRPSIIEMTIREYLELSGETLAPSKAIEVLKVVGLEPIIARFEEGLDTHVSATGWPLSITETMQLKLAAAIIAAPRVLIINQLYDLVPEDDLKRALSYVRQDPTKTLIYFSRRQRNLGCDTFLHIDSDRQIFFETFEDFHRYVYGTSPGEPGGPQQSVDGPTPVSLIRER